MSVQGSKNRNRYLYMSVHNPEAKDKFILLTRLPVGTAL